MEGLMFLAVAGMVLKVAVSAIVAVVEFIIDRE